MREQQLHAPLVWLRKVFRGKWKMGSTTVWLIKARSCQTNKIFDEVSDSWGKSKCSEANLSGLCYTFNRVLQRKWLNMEQTATSTGHQWVWKLLKWSQATKRGRLSEVHLRDQSGGKITGGVGCKECTCGYEVCDRHKAGRHCYYWGLRKQEHSSILERGWGGAHTLKN